MNISVGPVTLKEKVIYKSCPTPLGQRKKSAPLPLGKQISDKDRIEKIINDLFEFGVGIEFLFDVDDLLLNKNMKKVKQLIKFRFSTYPLKQKTNHTRLV